MKIKHIWFLVFNFLAIQAFSQTGTIRGKVIDAETGEEMIAATVGVVGTAMGAMADFDGAFSINNVPAGTYSLKASFISYEAKVISNVEVKEGETVIINFNLGQANTEIEEVLVTAKVNRKTEASVLTIQKKSANFVNGISAQMMSKLGDSDAAGALKRVTGISIQGGKYVYVRGLSDRYSKTTLNGAEIPGLDPNKNTVQMDMFPNNIIDNIIVHKTFSPELPGSFTGGYVDIRTKDFPDKFIFSASSSYGYNAQSNLNTNFLSHQGSSSDWFAFGNKSRQLPSLAIAEIPSRCFCEDDKILDQITESFNKNMDTDTTTSGINQSYAFSIGNQMELLGKTFGYNAAFSYSNNYSYYNNGIVASYKLKDANSETLSEERYYDTDIESANEVIWAGLLNMNLKLNQNNMLGFVWVRNQSGEKSTSFSQGIKPSDDPNYVIQLREMEWLQRSLSAYQLKGEHVIKALNTTKIEWISSFTQSAQYQPDYRIIMNHFDKTTGTYEIAPSLYDVPTRFFRDMTETNFDNKLHIKIPISSAITLKTGGSYVAKNRNFNDKKFEFHENTNSYNGDIDAYFDNQNMDPMTGIYVTNSSTTDKKNSYIGQQSIAAAYLMSDLKFGKLRMIVGARFETTQINIESLKADEKKAELDSFDILPAFNLSYELIKDMNIRFAYTKTLARPSFRELAPFAATDFRLGRTIVGNPDLQRTLINNIDFRWEYFLKKGQTISAGLFYKTFENPIEATFNTVAVNAELTYRNVELATVSGAELEFRKNIFRDFQWGANFTYVFSKVSIGEQELLTKRAFDPTLPDSRVMTGQSPLIFNTYLSYNNIASGWAANLVFNYQDDKLVIVNSESIPDIYEQGRKVLDFNLSKTWNEKYHMKFSMKNLLDAKYQQTYHYNNVDYIYKQYSLGRTYSISFSYSIK